VQHTQTDRAHVGCDTTTYFTRIRSAGCGSDGDELKCFDEAGAGRSVGSWRAAPFASVILLRREPVLVNIEFRRTLVVNMVWVEWKSSVDWEIINMVVGRRWSLGISIFLRYLRYCGN
jgi:hypothetical protein